LPLERNPSILEEASKTSWMSSSRSNGGNAATPLLTMLRNDEGGSSVGGSKGVSKGMGGSGVSYGSNGGASHGGMSNSGSRHGEGDNGGDGWGGNIGGSNRAGSHRWGSNGMRDGGDNNGGGSYRSSQRGTSSAVLLTAGDGNGGGNSGSSNPAWGNGKGDVLSNGLSHLRINSAPSRGPGLKASARAPSTEDAMLMHAPPEHAPPPIEASPANTAAALDQHPGGATEEALLMHAPPEHAPPPIETNPATPRGPATEDALLMLTHAPPEHAPPTIDNTAASLDHHPGGGQPSFGRVDLTRHGAQPSLRPDSATAQAGDNLAHEQEWVEGTGGEAGASSTSSPSLPPSNPPGVPPSPPPALPPLAPPPHTKSPAGATGDVTSSPRSTSDRLSTAETAAAADRSV